MIFYNLSPGDKLIIEGVPVEIISGDVTIGVPVEADVKVIMGSHE